MILENVKEPKVINKKDNLATVEIEGLYPGYGTTVGNSLRRVLLSSLEGSAVTQVKIKGVGHEFTTIEGVLEDVIVLTMNLKEMRFKQHDDEPQTASLKVKGEKKVLASDFKYPSQVEIANPDHHILTLTDKKSEIDMEIKIEKGIGYEPVENRKKQEKKEVGVILVDAIFSPVKRVTFKVENMRVGKRTDYDKLFLEIETDGTVLPEQAFKKAAGILTDHFDLFSGSFEEQEKGIEELKLSTKTLNALKENNIKTVKDILKQKDLSALSGVGKKALKEIEKALKKIDS